MDAVERGARLLDFKCPGWFQKINRVTLDMADNKKCILGQVYGDYTQGALQVGLETPRSRFEHGFAVPGIITGEVVECKRAWSCAIEARLTAAKAATPMPCDAIASFHYAMALAHGPLMSRAHLEGLNGAQLLDILVDNNIHFEYRGPIG